MALGSPRFLILLTVAFAATYAHGQTGITVLHDGWRPFEKGFTSLARQGKTGGMAIYCESPSVDGAHGALYTVTLNQRTAQGFTISAWSRCKDVNGTADSGYSLYIDLKYMDGGHLWGSISPFAAGTHGWEERHVRILPAKPVQEALVYLLLRGHTGGAWFSDASISGLGGKDGFDFQPIRAPVVTSDGWFVRDVGASSPVVAISKCPTMGLQAVASSSGASRTLRIRNPHGVDRALTLYYCEKLISPAKVWWNSIRSPVPIGDSECANFATVSTGANGLSSLYPFATVTSNRFGRMLAVPPSVGPRVVRLFYNPAARILCAAFDVGLTRLNRLHPSEASAVVFKSDVDPRWGLRDAARIYYAAFPEAFRGRMPKQGIWIPFTNPASVPHPEDFGFAVHEGDNSVVSDARLGILSFRYTEPMTWWMNMAPSVPRTYPAAMDVLAHNLSDQDRRQAEAVLSSGSCGPDGRYNVSFENQPWANGAVWILNPNPAIERQKGRAIQADLVFDPKKAEDRYRTTRLSGEYLDSLEAHSEVVDYRPASIAASSFPPSFDEDTKQPVIPQAYSTYEIARAMSDRLHAMGKLLMANTTPVNCFGYMPLLDCAGIEVNWLDGGKWTPDGDDVFCYRRTMSYHKPYMLLQNTDFSKFGPKQVSLYFKKCLFYAVYPSFFSANAATHVYWENSGLYNRDRPEFKSTIPLIRMLSEAGWEPVTNARTNDAAIFIERYGGNTWTLFNDGDREKSFTVTFDGARVGKSAKDLVTGETFVLTHDNARVSIRCDLGPGDCKVVRVAAD